MPNFEIFSGARRDRTADLRTASARREQLSDQTVNWQTDELVGLFAGVIGRAHGLTLARGVLLTAGLLSCLVVGVNACERTPKLPKKTAHPGVTLAKPCDGQPHWRARFKDAETGKHKWLVVPAEHAATAATREAFAVALFERLTADQAKAAEPAKLTISQGVELFFGGCSLSPRAVSTYRATAKLFEAWCSANKIATLDQLNRQVLRSFKDHLKKLPKRQSRKGGKRGELVAVGKRSGQTINKELAHTRAILSDLENRELLASVTQTDLRKSLKKDKTARKEITFFRTPQIRQALTVALAHDALCFAETRAEHRGRGVVGTTTRHKPIGPFVAAVLLGGARLEETLTFDWARIDEHRVHLRAQDCKGGKDPRDLTLNETPLLRRLLAFLRAAQGNPTKGPVFDLTRDEVVAAHKRLVTLGAPERFGWHELRRTCATFLTNAPGVYGTQSPWLSAARCGHSVEVAKESYLGILREIPREATTLEQAMGCEAQLQLIVKSIGAPPHVLASDLAPKQALIVEPQTEQEAQAAVDAQLQAIAAQRPHRDVKDKRRHKAA